MFVSPDCGDVCLTREATLAVGGFVGGVDVVLLLFGLLDGLSAVIRDSLLGRLLTLTTSGVEEDGFLTYELVLRPVVC